MIDPTTRRVTHVVVERDRDPWLARLVPVELVERADGARTQVKTDAVTVRLPGNEVGALPPVALRRRLDPLEGRPRR